MFFQCVFISVKWRLIKKHGDDRYFEHWNGAGRDSLVVHESGRSNKSPDTFLHYNILTGEIRSTKLLHERLDPEDMTTVLFNNRLCVALSYAYVSHEATHY